MALQVKWTENALEDYRLVIEYLLLEWSVDIAERFVDIMEKRIDTLSVFPHIGIASEKEDKVRSIAVTKHNRLYYQISDTSIVILNIFDTRKNPGKNKYE